MNFSSFTTQTLFEATAQLFAELGIKINVTTSQALAVASILKASYRDREPFTLVREAYFIGVVDSSTFAAQPDLFTQTVTLEAVQQKAEHDDNYTGLLVFALDLGAATPTRTQLAELARAFNRVSNKLPVAVVFHYVPQPNKPLLSMAAVERVRYGKGQAWRPGEKLGKVSILKDIDLQRTHTGHLRILQELDLRRRTGKQAIRNFRDFYKLWQDTFSVSLLNRRFYRDLFHWYLWAVREVQFPKPDTETLSDEAYVSVSVIRLLTRLIFVWFVKEKGLIPNRLFDKTRLLDLLLGADGEPINLQSTTCGAYYQAILQNLFFATLNTPMDADAKTDGEKRQFTDDTKRGNWGHNDDYGNQTRYRYADLFRKPDEAPALFASVPFLNGGLFECLDRTANKELCEDERRYDGFTRTKSKRAHVPNALFFGSTELDLADEYNDSKPHPEAIRGLIDILNSYKFTVAENTPFDEEVALDPELLGRVFENLLASYNPETKSTARKQTGSFYTPREIVSYMVDESLKTYLLQKLTTPVAVAHAEFGRQQTQLFGNEVKRGQLGLHETVATIPTMPETEARQRLDRLFDDTLDDNPFTDVPNACQTLIEAIGAANILDPACGSGAFPMGILHRMVSLLARLDPENRGWREVQKQKAIGETQTAFDEGNRQQREERLRQINDAFEYNSTDYGRKLYLIENCIYGVDIQQIAKLRFFISLIVEQRVDDSRPNRNILSMPNLETKFVAANTLIKLEKQLNLFAEDPHVKQIEKDLNELRQQIFFVRSYANKKQLQRKEASKRLELEQVLLKSGYSKGMAVQIAGWNPFDVTHSAPFFDQVVMFNFMPNEGFDIVIGNPPYVRHEEIKAQKASLQLNFESTFVGTADLLVYFYEKGLRLLRDGGILTYITSNKFMKANFGQKLRTYLWQYDIHRLTDFGELPVFENVATFPLIAEIIKRPNPQRVWFTQVKALTGGTLARTIEQTGHALTKDAFAGGNWSLSVTEKNNVIDVMQKNGLPLKAYISTKIFYGLKTGFNKAYIINESTKLRLLEEDEKSADLIKPFALGDDVRRNFIRNDKQRHIILMKIGVNAANYPAIMKHLGRFEKQLKARSDQGANWWELRACAYYDRFEAPKILYPDIAKESRFCLDDTGFYCADTAFFIPGCDKFLLGILNSKAAWYQLKIICSALGDADNGGRLRLKSKYMDRLLVPQASTEAKLVLEGFVNGILKSKAAGQDTTVFEQAIDSIVYQLYGLTYEEVLVVEPTYSVPRAAYEAEAKTWSSDK